jgi:phage-related minor tail protein
MNQRNCAIIVFALSVLVMSFSTNEAAHFGRAAGLEFQMKQPDGKNPERDRGMPESARAQQIMKLAEGSSGKEDTRSPQERSEDLRREIDVLLHPERLQEQLDDVDQRAKKISRMEEKLKNLRSRSAERTLSEEGVARSLDEDIEDEEKSLRALKDEQEKAKEKLKELRKVQVEPPLEAKLAPIPEPEIGAPSSLDELIERQNRRTYDSYNRDQSLEVYRDLRDQLDSR